MPRKFSPTSQHNFWPGPCAKDKNDALRKVPQLQQLIGNRIICVDPPQPKGRRACVKYEDKVLQLHELGYTPHMISMVVRRLRLSRVYSGSIKSCLRRNGLEPHTKRRYDDFD